MGRSKKPRKAYRPREARLRAHEEAILGVAKLTVDERATWEASLSDAITAIARAQAQQSHWATVFDGINLVEQAMLAGFGQDPHGLVDAAQEACVAILDRQRLSGIRAARAQELAAMRDAAAAFGDLMASLTVRQRVQLDEACARRVQRALASKDSQARIIDAAKVFA